MKKFLLLFSLGLLAAAHTHLNAAPLLRYEFSQTGSTQSSTGSAALDLTLANYAGTATDYITAAPVQAPGASSSNALNFTSTNVDSGVALPANIPKGAAYAALNDGNAAFLRSDLSSFTVTAWVLNSTFTDPSINLRRLFSLRNGANTAVVELSLSRPAGGGANNGLSLTLTGSQGSREFAPSTALVPDNSDTWFFISISYDAATGNVGFHTGAEGGELTSTFHFNGNGSGVNTLLQNSTQLSIGNVGYIHQRRFDGYISDVRFYDEALSLQDIQAIHAIPEPATTALLGVSALLAFTYPWKLLKRP